MKRTSLWATWHSSVVDATPQADDLFFLHNEHFAQWFLPLKRVTGKRRDHCHPTLRGETTRSRNSFIPLMMWNSLAGAKAVRVKRRWSFLWARQSPVLTDGDRKTVEALQIRKEACGKGLRETPGQMSSPAGTNWAAQPPQQRQTTRADFTQPK